LKTTKAKRRLTNISFEHEGAHLALTSKTINQGSANGHNKGLIMKGTAQFSDEFIEKMQAVRVTMELPDFLEKFFHLYEEDAEVLAAMMGYTPDAETPEGENAEDTSGMYEDDCFYDWWKERLPEGTDPYMVEPTEQDYKDYIAARLQGIEVLMSLRDAETLPEGLSALDESAYLGMLKDQERLEKAFQNEEFVQKGMMKSAKAKGKKKAAGKTVRSYSSGSSESTAASAGTMTVTMSKSEEIIKMPKAQETQAPVQSEVVEKSQFEAVQKAFEEQKELLQKALEQVELFKAKEKEALQKARFAQLKDAVKDEAKAVVLFKAASLLESDEDFTEVVKALGDMTKLVEKSELFTEVGNSTDEAGKAEESAIQKAVMAQIKKLNK